MLDLKALALDLGQLLVVGQLSRRSPHLLPKERLELLEGGAGVFNCVVKSRSDKSL